MKIQFKSEYENDHIIYNHCIKTEQTQQDYHPHYHDMYEILFLKEGDISYLTENCAYSTRKNSLIFIPPRQQHCIRIDKNTPYDRYDLLFSPESVDSDLLEAITGKVSVIGFDTNQLVIQLFEKIDFYCEKLTGEALGKVIHALTEEVLLNIYLHVTASAPNTMASRQPLTDRALAYIEENLLTLTGVEPICHSLGISRSYLYQLFQQDLQTTPKQYIMERRLNLARQEIFLGAKATTVYTQCGFADYSTFFRAYKKHFGYPPTGTHHASFVRSSNDDIFRGHTE